MTTVRQWIVATMLAVVIETVVLVSTPWRDSLWWVFVVCLTVSLAAGYWVTRRTLRRHGRV